MSSLLSLHVKRLGEVLRFGAEEQVDESKTQLESASDLYEDFLSELIVTDFDYAKAYDVAKMLFGSSRVKFAAVDGSQDQRLVSGLAVFWGGAYASTGTIEFKADGPPSVEYATGFIERGHGVSSCVPVYVDRIPEIDQMIMELSGPGHVTVTKPLTDQAVVDNSSIASWIMTFSELYLAYRLVIEEDLKILLLDKSLSNTQTSLMYDTSRRPRWKTEGAIHGFEIDGVPIDMNEMGYGRHYIINSKLQTPPARGDYLRYATIFLLQAKGIPMSFEEICEGLGVESRDRADRVLKYLKKSVEEHYVLESAGHYRLNSRYANSWERLKKLVRTIGDKLFRETGSNPMRLKKGEGYQWLTTQDLAFLSLYCLYMLMEECWARGIFLVGITKDTTARDFKSHLIPVCVTEGIWHLAREKLERIPSTDRMFLQAVSFSNCERIPVPWSLIEYDSAFQLIVPDFSNRKGFVSGAVRNKITPSKLFAKTYVQLDCAKRDPMLRSNVLFIDRLAYPEFDLDATVKFLSEYGGAIEPVEVILYRDRKVQNKLQNLMMIVLRAMGARSIPEVFGHNKPLFIADKIAKGQRERVKGIIEATGHWLMNNQKLRRFSFYMNTFRERRAEVEYARRGP